METMNSAIAFVLLDAVAVALSVDLGRASQRGETLTAASVRFFILVLMLLFLALAAFSLRLAGCLVLAYLLRKYCSPRSPR